MPDPTEQPGRTPRALLRHLLPLLGVLIAVAGLGFVARSLLSNWDETVELISNAEPLWLVAAVPVCLMGMTCVGLPWRSVLAALGERRGTLETLRWYFPGQLGKYVPGGIWPVIGRGELAARGGVARPVAYTSVALSLACTYLAATLTAIVLLALSLLSGEERGGPPWALLLLPLGLVALHPTVLRRLVAAAEQLMSRQFPVTIPDYRTTVSLIAQHVPAWILIGGGTWLVARAFDPDVPVMQVLFAGVISWVVGFVVIPVPGGIGVREAAFVAAAATLAPDLAATTAIVSRLCFIAVDLVGAGLVVSIPRLTGSRTASPSEPRDVPPAGS